MQDNKRDKKRLTWSKNKISCERNSQETRFLVAVNNLKRVTK